MKQINCGKGITTIIRRATDKLGNTAAFNIERFRNVQTIGNCIDRLIQEHPEDVQGVDIHVEIAEKSVTILLFCDSIIFEKGNTDIFFQLIQEFQTFSISVPNVDVMQLELSIFDMWV